MIAKRKGKNLFCLVLSIQNVISSSKIFVFTFCKISLHLHKENSFAAKSKKELRW